MKLVLFFAAFYLEYCKNNQKPNNGCSQCAAGFWWNIMTACACESPHAKKNDQHDHDQKP